MAFRDIEALVKAISDKSAVGRARRLHYRAGVAPFEELDAIIENLAIEKSKLGYDAFKFWAESPGQGIVLTAHPTFSLSAEIRDTLGAIATEGSEQCEKETEHLKTLPFLQKAAPTLQEEHRDTQAAIRRIQDAMGRINRIVLEVAAKAFPDQWTELTPCLAKVYSWVGYDIDGRTDIGWADAIRLRLSEKYQQLLRNKAAAHALLPIAKDSPALGKFVQSLTHACESTERDLTLFNEDMHVPENLIAAANNFNS